MSRHIRTDVQIEAGSARLDGTLTLPESIDGLVVFAHGSGSSRRSPRNRFIAEYLNDRNLATLLFDLLTAREEELDARTTELRFDIDLLATRLTATVDWVSHYPRLAHTNIGLFGASTGAAGALITAAERPALVHAVVSRGGRPDLAGPALPRISAPTLLIVGGDDDPVIHLNQQAADRIKASHQLKIIPGATHLFEEPGALEKVAELAARWFMTHLAARAPKAELR